MKNSYKAIIIVTVVIFALVISLGYLATWSAGVDHHREICHKWKATLDTDKTQLESNMFRGDAEVAQFNAEISDYNQKCAY